MGEVLSSSEISSQPKMLNYIFAIIVRCYCWKQTTFFLQAVVFQSYRCDICVDNIPVQCRLLGRG